MVTASSLFTNIDKAAKNLITTAEAFDKKATHLADKLATQLHHHKRPSRALIKAIRAVNTRYKYFERQFLYPAGLDSRSWFKHVIFAPGKWTGYAGATFPGLVEALDEQNATQAKKWSGIIEANIDAAAIWLQG